ncbi:MAG: phosphoglucomutase [Flavobacteriaceae bacterium]|nr:MAG: phosphoglucomutase [Flavobacteriaceae bacterium]
MNATQTPIERAQDWLNSSVFDVQTKEEVNALIAGDPSNLEDSFYKDLEFGTGGIRGKMGVGTNRINVYTLGRATQGLSQYLKNTFSGEIKIAIGYDVRHNSKAFARAVAEIFSANGIRVFLFEDFRPTPLLSFAVRELGCQAGIVLTASHNPPIYNGYKVYFSSGAQIVPPEDSQIISEIQKTSFEQIRFEANSTLIETIGEEIDQKFIQQSLKACGIEDSIAGKTKIVFTPIHGTSVHLLPKLLKQAGFDDVHLVESQAVPSGDFPTVKSPNPEEPEALEKALELAKEIDADVLFGTDPDADRLGIGVKDLTGNWQLLNGNQTNAVLVDFLLEKRKEQGLLKPTDFVGSTIVSSDLIISIANHYGVQCKVGLTGFKWIAKMIEDFSDQTFVCGGEESYGFMVGDFVRDKDALTSALLVVLACQELKAKGSSFYQKLLEIYTRSGLYREDLISLTKEGVSGQKEIASLMQKFRSTPPKEFAGEKIISVDDYLHSTSWDYFSKIQTKLEVPKSDVLIFYTVKGLKIALRPSGTEPKIKFYTSSHLPMSKMADYPKLLEKSQKKLEDLKMQLLEY